MLGSEPPYGSRLIGLFMGIVAQTVNSVGSVCGVDSSIIVTVYYDGENNTFSDGSNVGYFSGVRVAYFILGRLIVVLKIEKVSAGLATKVVVIETQKTIHGKVVGRAHHHLTPI